jgi:hypothetical protein
MDQLKPSNDRFDFSPLELPDEVPRHSATEPKIVYFQQGLLKPVLTQKSRTRIHGGAYTGGIDGLRHRNELNALRIASDTSRGVFDPIADVSEILRNGISLHGVQSLSSVAVASQRSAILQEVMPNVTQCLLYGTERLGKTPGQEEDF